MTGCSRFKSIVHIKKSKRIGNHLVKLLGKRNVFFSVYIISVVLDYVLPNFVESKNRLAANIQTTSIKAVLSLHVFIK